MGDSLRWKVAESGLLVELSASPNPDYEGGDTRGNIRVPSRLVPVRDLDEAVKVVQSFLRKHNLGGGNWTGGNVYLGDRTRIVAYISYNGRVWESRGGREIRLASTNNKAVFLSAIRTAIKDVGVWPRMVSAWVRMHGGREGLADLNEKRVREAVRLLEEVLGAFPEDVTYKLVTRSGTKTYTTSEALLEDLASVGIEPIRYSPDRGPGLPILWSQPIFSSSKDNVTGPFGDGPGVIRYEAKYLVVTPTGLAQV